MNLDKIRCALFTGTCVYVYSVCGGDRELMCASAFLFLCLPVRTCIRVSVCVRLCACMGVCGVCD